LELTHKLLPPNPRTPARKFTVAAPADRSTSWEDPARRNSPESKIRRVKGRDEHSDNIGSSRVPKLRDWSGRVASNVSVNLYRSQ